MKAITTRSGVAYEGPSIPTNPSPKRFAPVTIKCCQWNMEKLLELAKITVLNEYCSTCSNKSFPKKSLDDPDKFLIPCNFTGIVDQTTRYSSTNDKSVNRIDIIDAVCEEYALEFLGFSNSSGGNPTPTSEPFTSEFILEEIEAYLKDDSIHRKLIRPIADPEETLKKKLYEVSSILVVPDWNLPFELMCDASDFAIGAVLGQ
ncbi:reverse transcriptase domain-containing protein [Tanacetum coccineum]